MYPDNNEIIKTAYKEIFVTVPENVDLMYINNQTQSGNSINELHVYKILDGRYEYVKGQDIKIPLYKKGNIRVLLNISTLIR